MSETSWMQVPDANYEEIVYEKKRFANGSVARITFNRPERLNAMTLKGQYEVAKALVRATVDDSVGAVVLTGAGDRAFCVGGDLSWEAGGGLLDQVVEEPDWNSAVLDCPKPVIAAVQGWCIGGGHHLAYCCDFTIATEDSRFGQNGPRVGSPADGFRVAYLTRVIGAKKAREVWMLARRYSAAEALDMGLVNKVVPTDQLESEVEAWCEEILALSPTCLKVLKASFNSDFDYMRSSIHRYERMIATLSFHGSDEQKEAQAAFFEKRPPEFGQFRPEST
jgi:dihydroxynaphthoic acid synthetase